MKEFSPISSFVDKVVIDDENRMITLTFVNQGKYGPEYKKYLYHDVSDELLAIVERIAIASSWGKEFAISYKNNTYSSIGKFVNMVLRKSAKSRMLQQ